MQVYKYLIAFGLLSALNMACEPDMIFPEEPVISDLSFQAFADSSGELRFSFTDGDGNIGLNLEGDTLPPYDIEGDFYFNLRIEYQELVNNEWVSFPGAGFSQRILPFAAFGEPYEGDMTVDLPIYFNPNSPNPTLRFLVTLIDRDLNLSNTLESEPIPKP